MQVTKEGNVLVEKAHWAAEAVRENTAKALPEALAVPEQAQAAAKAKASDALATSFEALQRAKLGAEETLVHMSRKLSEVAQEFGSTAAQQARQVAAPVQAAALRARSAAVRSAQRGADAVHAVTARAMQVGPHNLSQCSELGQCCQTCQTPGLSRASMLTRTGHIGTILSTLR